MIDRISMMKEECLKATTNDPIELALSIMHMDGIPMHGPEHHVLDGACLLTALHNAGVAFDLSEALDEMILRGSKMPGATCGQWGVCGSCASVGAALSILHGTGPLSHDEYYKDHMHCVSRALGRLSEIGGPRCCKRNAFLSIQTAVDFVNERYGLHLPMREIHCTFSPRNGQCIGTACPFFGGERE